MREMVRQCDMEGGIKTPFFSKVSLFSRVPCSHHLVEPTNCRSIIPVSPSQGEGNSGKEEISMNISYSTVTKSRDLPGVDVASASHGSLSPHPLVKV